MIEPMIMKIVVSGLVLKMKSHNKSHYRNKELLKINQLIVNTIYLNHSLKIMITLMTKFYKKHLINH
jgi:hypothetical protein